jgi:hypothetical protein
VRVLLGLDLASSDPADHDGGADHIGGALLASGRPLGILVIARLGPRGLGGQGGIMCLCFLPCIVCHSRDLTGR